MYVRRCMMAWLCDGFLIYLMEGRFSMFLLQKRDPRTDGRTAGHTLYLKCKDASKKKEWRNIDANFCQQLSLMNDKDSSYYFIKAAFFAFPSTSIASVRSIIFSCYVFHTAFTALSQWGCIVFNKKRRGRIFASIQFIDLRPCNYRPLRSAHSYNSAQIKWDILQIEFSLSFKMIKTKIISPFEAPGNVLKIESNRRFVAWFV